MINKTNSLSAHKLINWLIIIILGINWYSGFLGIDFGIHWDESIQINLIQNSLQKGSLLPWGFYNYPSITYWLTLLGAIPNVIKFFISSDPQWIASIGTPAVLLQVRIIFVVVSSMTILWIYYGLLILKRKPIQALLASAILSFSWEFAYHQRWVAPDAILAQFGALVFLFLALSYNRQKEIWFYFAAAVAGIAMSTKYPGGLLLIPVIALFIKLSYKKQSFLEIAKKIILQIGIFIFAFTLFTPGIIYERHTFLNQVQLEMNHYAQVGHGVYSVSPGIEHFLKIIGYSLTIVFSSRPYFGIVIFLMAFLGCVSLIRKKNYALWIIYFIFPMVYILYFSLQRVMIVRNLLVLFPFFSLLIAEGVVFLVHLLISWQRSVLIFIIAIILFFNIGWLVYAAESIPTYDQKTALQQLDKYILQHPNSLFYLKTDIVKSFVEAGIELPANTNFGENYKGDYFVFFGKTPLQANDPFLITQIFGPLEVNFAMYPNWQGPSRYLIIPMQKAIGYFNIWWLR